MLCADIAMSLYKLQVDQGLGIGTNFPFFNRHQLTVTQFLQLKSVEEGAGKSPPPVLVLHGHYGGCVGDLPSYDAFTLGGPYSVRGYNMGEIGAARNILEVGWLSTSMTVNGDTIVVLILQIYTLSSKQLSYFLFFLTAGS